MSNQGIIAKQFAKHRAAVWGMRLLIALGLLATYAPVIALNRPFVWTDANGDTSFPWLASLADPTVFELGVDVFFNMLMFVLPLAVLAWKLLGGRRLRYALSGLLLLHLALFAFFAWDREAWRRPVQDYVAADAAGEGSGFFPPVPHHYSERDSRFSLTPPFSEGTVRDKSYDGPRPYYILGSDNLGNDVLTRLLYGTRISLTIGFVAVAIYATIGIVLGAIAGYFGGWVDDVLMFVAQAVMTIPALFLILFLISVLEKPGIYDIMLVIAFISWPTIMRLVRGEFLRQREIDYVAAARSLGYSDRRIMFRHVVPNAMAPVFYSATFGVAVAILFESSISFLGLGDPSAPSWGQMLNVGYLTRPIGTHLIWASGLAIFVTVLVINLIGEALRDALDPKLRK